MQFSKFGEKFTKNSGILQLMDDLGNALNSEQPINMLGGGNPARIDKVNQTYWEIFQSLAQGELGSTAIENIGNYSTHKAMLNLSKRWLGFLTDIMVGD